MKQFVLCHVYVSDLFVQSLFVLYVRHQVLHAVFSLVALVQGGAVQFAVGIDW